MSLKYNGKTFILDTNVSARKSVDKLKTTDPTRDLDVITESVSDLESSQKYATCEVSNLDLPLDTVRCSS